MRFSITSMAFAAIAALPFGADSSPTQQLPLLKLPYGTWRANMYSQEGDFYLFSNIRYAAPPTGSRRFIRPQPPLKMEEIQDGSVGYRCPQQPGVNKGELPISEDCLFLDVQVPAKVLQNKKKDTPVIFMIHGGGYTQGSKGNNTTNEPNINGAGVIPQLNHNVIYVAINYRLGALGWLNGEEAEKAKATNLGLHDQRAALEWVQNYIHLVGGNSCDVIAWGLSAGGGSIVHHLTQYGGRRDPLFRQALVQSPGWFGDWSRKAMDEGFGNFTEKLGCSSAVNKWACLQKASVKDIANATTLLRRTEPVPDGDWVEVDPKIAFKTGAYWKKQDSVISTHVQNEIPWFLGEIRTDAEFFTSMLALFPDFQIAQEIAKRYPSNETAGSPFSTHQDRAAAVISDYIFSVNSVALAGAYPGKAYHGIYSVKGALHANDVEIPYLYKDKKPFTGIDQKLSLAYQNYFLNQIRSKNANAPQVAPDAPIWPTFDPVNTKALNVTDIGLKVTTTKEKMELLQFWTDALVQLSLLQGSSK